MTRNIRTFESNQTIFRMKTDSETINVLKGEERRFYGLAGLSSVLISLLM
ncbi:hypothetical protein PAHA111176_14760 [Parendozoicomonas haliclonae]|uniref:Uncharacterized protein n=1 Tax=Parendozoicomonas haliclonae TaxID=1960125 RepID=A0A1X7AHF5_9GAMM|nr:hypothetical protein EHSB41UT_01431 [Parendozoicomonas haliclonae]